MAKSIAVQPQPLNGDEIRIGIAARIALELPEELREKARRKIEAGLRRTCSLVDGAAYSKLRAEWAVAYIGESISWTVKGTLDDFGRGTPFYVTEDTGEGFGNRTTLSGTIEEMPPDKFRRETDQPIPKPRELKKPEDEPRAGIGKARRGRPKKRRTV